MITIGNPIFDSVFKFFLADDVSARILLSVLIKQKVTKLETRKNEFMQKGHEGEISVMRIDFAAHVLSTDEEGKEVDRLIIIELQKAWVNYEVPRFRRYLGNNYIASENIFHDANDDRDYGLPIVAIYILNHRVGTLAEPVVRIGRKYTDYDGNEITRGVPDKFAESLSHDCIIVQVPLLTGKIRNRAEKILQIFNQKFSVKQKSFKMQFDDTLADDDAEMKQLVKRLSMVFADEYTTEKMIVENEEYQVYAENLAAKTKLAEQNATIAKQNEQLAKQDEQLAKQNEMLANKDKELEEKGNELLQRDSQLAESIKMLSSFGVPVQQIAERLKIPASAVDKLLG